MTRLDAMTLGIVEGMTEYLPISSTGRLILTQWFLGLDQDPELSLAMDRFNIVIQAGAIIAVLGLYRMRVNQMVHGTLSGDEAGRRLALQLMLALRCLCLKCSSTPAQRRLVPAAARPAGPENISWMDH